MQIHTMIYHSIIGPQILMSTTLSGISLIVKTNFNIPLENFERLDFMIDDFL